MRSNPEILTNACWIAEPVPNVVKDRGLLAMTEYEENQSFRTALGGVVIQKKPKKKAKFCLKLNFDITIMRQYSCRIIAGLYILL